MIRLIAALLRSEDGATLVEYALVVALIAIVCILAVTKLGGSTQTELNKAATSI
jgi:pilus assembly protein Flp/PilA